MKVTNLFVATLWVTTAWTHSTPPLVLFAKFNTTWLPLTKRQVDLTFYLSAQKSSDYPAKFILKNGYIMSPENRDSQYLGLYVRALVIGLRFFKERFEFDRNGKILHKSFFNCKMGNKDFVLTYGRGIENCTAVDIYLLPYNERTRSPMQNIPDSDVKKLIEDSEKSSKDDRTVQEPLLLQIQVGENLVPLASIKDKSSENLFFVWGNKTLNHIELLFRNGHIYTKNTPVSHRVGFYSNQLSFGPNIKSTRWSLNKEHIIDNVELFSCNPYDNSDHNLNVITLNRSYSTNCSAVDIYLKPYDIKIPNAD